MTNSAEKIDELFYVMGHLQAAGIDSRDSRRLISKMETDRLRTVGWRYNRGDWVQIRYCTDKTRLAIIHDRSDRSLGNYRGSVIAGSRACSERTILATEIIGLAPENKRLRDAKALIGRRE